MKLVRLSVFITCAFFMVNEIAIAQFQRGPQVISPELKEGKVTFRLLAPNAKTVRLNSSDMPGVGQGPN